MMVSVLVFALVFQLVVQFALVLVFRSAVQLESALVCQSCFAVVAAVVVVVHFHCLCEIHYLSIEIAKNIFECISKQSNSYRYRFHWCCYVHILVDQHRLDGHNYWFPRNKLFLVHNWIHMRAIFPILLWRIDRISYNCLDPCDILRLDI